MKILSMNAGSSSLKMQLYEMPEETLLISMLFERIGFSNSHYTITINNQKIKNEHVFNNHEDAVKVALEELINQKVINNLEEIKAAGHRVVHGGDKYSGPVVVNEDVIRDIENLCHLSPLHNPANLLGVKVLQKALPSALEVVSFDTAFHQTISKEAYLYAVPYEWYEKYGVRKYGFHGTSHKYISERISEILGRKDLRIISCHLGSGNSITAIKDGKSVDTSMGFTPLAGLMMGTRSGDIDVSIIQYIMKETGKTIDEVMYDLNNNSGLLGLSGVSNDLRDIQQAVADNNERAILARDVYVRRIVSYISFYYTILGGVDVIVFTAGAGENDADIRREVLKQLKPLGVVFDEEKNNCRSSETLLSTDDSLIKCYVIPTKEELMIVKETYALFQ